MCICASVTLLLMFLFTNLCFFIMCEQALQKQYGSEGISKDGMDLLLVTVSKMFTSLQEAYKGQFS